MTSRILAAIAFAVPGTALAHTGHIADIGHGHDHWMVYWLAAITGLGVAIWAVRRLSAPAKANKRDLS